MKIVNTDRGIEVVTPCYRVMLERAGGFAVREVEIGEEGRLDRFDRPGEGPHPTCMYFDNLTVNNAFQLAHYGKANTNVEAVVEGSKVVLEGSLLPIVETARGRVLVRKEMRFAEDLYDVDIHLTFRETGGIDYASAWWDVNDKWLRSMRSSAGVFMPLRVGVGDSFGDALNRTWRSMTAMDRGVGAWMEMIGERVSAMAALQSPSPASLANGGMKYWDGPDDADAGEGVSHGCINLDVINCELSGGAPQDIDELAFSYRVFLTGPSVLRKVAVSGGWSPSAPVPDAAVRSTRLLRERLLADSRRPRYHFCLPEDMGEPGDPNGAFYYNGRYHLMYLYNRNGSGFCWGHVSSADLVHWRHHADAIGPGDGDEGCFSGGGFVDEDGTAVLSYWMLWGARGIGLARSCDVDFEAWEKLDANPVIHSTEWGLTEVRGEDGQSSFYGSADPSNIWKKDGRYYMLTGNLLVLDKIGREEDAPLSEQGDRLYLFVSDDLQKWQYLHVFYQRQPGWTERSEDNMCPSFLPLPAGPEGGPPSDKHLLLFISHNMGCQYYVGDYRDDRFYPDNHGRMSWVDNTYFAPEALIDGRGRQIMWAWLTDNPADGKKQGWSGVYGLPRSLWLGEDGTLRMRPAGELEMLRCDERVWEDLVLGDGETRSLDGVAGDACEIWLEIEVGSAARCGLKVRASGDGEEETLIYWDCQTQELVFDATRSGEAGRMVVERAPFELAPGEMLSLRVFVDRSVVELFANDRQAIGRRVYPGREDSLGVALLADGGTARFKRIRAWQMAPANPY